MTHRKGPKPVPVEVRFWRHVNKSGPVLRPELGPCWLWMGARYKKGYGLVHVGPGRTTGAHRYAFFLKFARWPEPCGLHRCDNPPCCNPDHVFEGDQADNARDMMAKGRHISHTNPGWYVVRDRETLRRQAARGDRNGARTRPERLARGERHAKSKLTAADVLEIRRRRARGDTLMAIAVAFEITDANVAMIASRKTWRHIP